MLWFGPGPALPGVKSFLWMLSPCLKCCFHTLYFFKSIALVCLCGRCAITIPEFPVSVSLVANIGARNRCCCSFHQCAKAAKGPKLEQEARSPRLKCYEKQTEQRANICKYNGTHTSSTYYLFHYRASLEGALAVNINRRVMCC